MYTYDYEQKNDKEAPDHYLVLDQTPALLELIHTHTICIIVDNFQKLFGMCVEIVKSLKSLWERERCIKSH